MLEYPVIFVPSRLVVQIGPKGFEKGFVELNLAALDALPGTVRGGARDGEVDPVFGDVVFLFVVGYRLEWGDYLSAISAERGRVSGKGQHTQTPPMSKRMAFGGAIVVGSVTMS